MTTHPFLYRLLQGNPVKHTFSALILISLLLLSGCGAHEAVLAPADVSWINFTGDNRGAMVSIDETPAFLLRNASFDKDGSGKPKWFRIAPGKHTVRITRNEQVIVERIFLIGNGQTKEIFIP